MLIGTIIIHNIITIIVKLPSKIHRTLTQGLRRLKTIHRKYLITPERDLSGKVSDKKWHSSSSNAKQDPLVTKEKDPFTLTQPRSVLKGISQSPKGSTNAQGLPRNLSWATRKNQEPPSSVPLLLSMHLPQADNGHSHTISPVHSSWPTQLPSLQSRLPNGECDLVHHVSIADHPGHLSLASQEADSLGSGALLWCN